MSERAPRTTGEVLSDGIGLLRSRFKTLYLLALPFCAVDLILREGGGTAMARARQLLSDNAKDLDVNALLKAGAAMAGSLGLLLGSFVVLTALSAGVVQLAADGWRGAPASFSSGVQAIVSRAAWVALTSLLFTLAFFVWLVPGFLVVGVAIALFPLAAQVVGVFLLLAWALLGLIVMTLRWGLFGQTVVLEERAGVGALRRSAELLAGRGAPFLESPKWRLSVLLLVSLAVTGTIQSVFAVPRLAYALVAGWDLLQGLPPLLTMPFYFVVPLALLEVALNAVVVTFGPVLLTLFYYDLRVRYEGLDLDDGA